MSLIMSLIDKFWKSDRNLETNEAWKGLRLNFDREGLYWPIKYPPRKYFPFMRQSIGQYFPFRTFRQLLVSLRRGVRWA